MDDVMEIIGRYIFNDFSNRDYKGPTKRNVYHDANSPNSDLSACFRKQKPSEISFY